MINPPTRLITGTRLLAEFLDNCPDGWVCSELAATVLVLLTVALHVVAEFLQTCSDLHEGK